MKFANVEALRFIEYRRPDGADIDDDTEAVAADEGFRKNYYAFTSLAHDVESGRLFCGTTNFAGDLLHAVDPATGAFESLGYSAVAEPLEIKIHRSLCVGPDGRVYGATSALGGLNEMAESTGGRLFAFDPAAGTYDFLGAPAPHLYLQTISLDGQRGMIYGMAYPSFEFFAFSLARREVVYRRYVGSIAHIGAVDPGGGYWGTWLGRRGRHCLFRYDGPAGRMAFHDTAFPTACRNLMYRGAGPIDAMIDGGDGRLYVGHESGELFGLDWRTGRLEYLAKPMPGQRLAGLAARDDGLLIGVGGSDWATFGFAYDRKTGRSEVLGELVGAGGGPGCFRTHDCCLVGDHLFVGETDHPRRGCYLWRCTLG